MIFCETVWKKGLARSKGEAKRLIIQGAIKLNGKVVTDPWLEVNPQVRIERR